MPDRGDFVKNQQSINPNPARFDMSENYDKSTYLTKVRRIQGRDFESYSKRNQEIIKQGGNDQFLDIIKDGARS